jgi:hypothetical protein
VIESGTVVNAFSSSTGVGSGVGSGVVPLLSSSSLLHEVAIIIAAKKRTIRVEKRFIIIFTVFDC